jgi:hypothetical protein
MTAVNRRRDLYLYEIATGQADAAGRRRGHRRQPGLVAGRQSTSISSRTGTRTGGLGHRVRLRDPEVDRHLRDPSGARHRLAGGAEVRRGRQRPGRGRQGDKPDEATPRKGGRQRRQGRQGQDQGKTGAKPAPDQPGPIAPIRIDLDGMMARAVALPVDPANIAQMDARGSRIFYLTQPIGLIDGP